MSDGVKGNPTNLPFKPPTLDEVELEPKVDVNRLTKGNADAKQLIDFNHLLNILPDLSSGIKSDLLIPSDLQSLFNSTDDDELTKFLADEQLPSAVKPTASAISSNGDAKTAIISNLIADQVSDEQFNELFLSIKDVDTKGSAGNNEWVETLDVNQKLAPFSELIPEPAFTYPFELDTFQKQAIMRLEQHDNVFVAAHTSAGKTVVAEYAIAMAIRRNLTRVIYTSPIKALSNQKFRDFQQTYGHKEVGILTGDVQINADAPCLIMTTEILLQMLYNGSDVIRDLEWVIFDEVHYCNDPERGHVWEEVFIMLPEHVSLVLLSATVDNVAQYADWLGRTRKKKTYVMATTKRPVPLEHYLYTGKGSKGKDQKFLLIDAGSNFLKIGYNRAVEAKQETESGKDKKYGRKVLGFQAEKNFYINVIRHLQADDKLPVIIFTLSRKRCDQNAVTLASAMDLTTANEKGTIHKYIKKSLNKLKPVDRSIPQVLMISDLLKKGFGVHHSGILPILKEITEILFQDNLVRVLFATETFAMGVNMPARSVAFDSINKHDGTCKRNLWPSEYIQMAGRAGRRGKDSTGTVLILCKQDIPEQSELFQMALGKPAPLVSQFRLTYAMILNLIRARHHLDIESVMKRSFIEHGKQIALQETVFKHGHLDKKIAAIKIDDCDECGVDLIPFCDRYLQYKELVTSVCSEQFKALKDKKCLEAGRLFLVESDHEPFTVGVLLEQRRALGTASQPVVTCLIVSASDLAIKGPQMSLVHIVDIPISSVHLVYAQVLKINFITIMRERSYEEVDEKIATKEALDQLYGYVNELSHQMDMSNLNSWFFIKYVDPVRDLKLNSLTFSEKYDQLLMERTSLLTYNCIQCPTFGAHFQRIHERAKLKRDLEQLTYDLSPQSMKFLPEYNQRVKVLEQLGYVSSEGYLEMKGRVACLFTDHELVLTELLVSNELSSLSVQEIAAIMSGFVFQQKLNEQQEQKKMSPELCYVSLWV